MNSKNSSNKTNSMSITAVNNVTCYEEATICKKDICDSPSFFRVNQISGNTYVNLLPETGVDVSYNPSLQIKQGHNKSDSLTLEDSFQKKILKNYNISIKERNPMIIVDVGPRHLQQQSYIKWVIASNPSYSYLGPWWLAVLSFNVLTQDLLEFTGTFSPGVCPYHFSPTTDELGKMEMGLRNVLNLSIAEFSIVQPKSKKKPTNTYINGTGISEPYKSEK